MDDEKTDSTKPTSAGRRFLLVLLGLLAAIVTLEVAVRFLPLLPITAMGAVVRRDPVLDHSLRPGSRGRMVSAEYDVIYQIDPHGFRDPTVKPHSVLILGDSFMEGYGVDVQQTLAELLEKRGIPTINAGVKSYSPLIEYLFLKRRGLTWNPRLVLLFLDLSDPANDRFYARRLVTDSSGEPLFLKPRRSRLWNPSGRIADWFDRHSVLFQHLEHLSYKYFPDTADVGYSGSDSALELLFAGRDSIPDTTYFPRWKTTLSYILRIHGLLREREIPFLLVTYPYGHEVSGEAWKEGRKAHRFPPGVSSDRPFRLVEEFARIHGIDSFRLDPAFRRAKNPGRFYYNFDGHWTAEGHAFAAALVEEEIRRRYPTMFSE
ncbi:MAG: hypothetical protein D6679_02920 [Candidatus Hydrogenedentota bacterium]|nr:MAG: hypothetical protein D6679_02920 [Candidatus Hydrogenedentota bacterium]